VELFGKPISLYIVPFAVLGGLYLIQRARNDSARQIGCRKFVDISKPEYGLFFGSILIVIFLIILNFFGNKYVQPNSLNWLYFTILIGFFGVCSVAFYLGVIIRRMHWNEIAIMWRDFRFRDRRILFGNIQSIRYRPVLQLHEVNDIKRQWVWIYDTSDGAAELVSDIYRHIEQSNFQPDITPIPPLAHP
jgi:hypothetical protein